MLSKLDAPLVSSLALGSVLVTIALSQASMTGAEPRNKPEYPGEYQEPSIRTRVEFVEPIEIEDVIEMSHQYGLAIESLEHIGDAVEKTTTGAIYIHDGGNVIEEIFSARRSFLKQMIESSEDESMGRLREHFVEQLDELDREGALNIRISGGVFVGSGKSVDVFLARKADMIDSSTSEQDFSNQSNTTSLNGVNRGTREGVGSESTALDRENGMTGTESHRWWPYTGAILTDYTPGGGGGWGSRFVQQQFRWSSSMLGVL